MKKLLLLLGVFMTFSFSAFSQHSPEVKIIKTGIDPATIIDYDINMDFNIQAVSAGVCFGETDPNNFFMWQINIEGGRSYFRPHVWNGGGAALVTEINIASLIIIEPNVTYAYRIEIRGDKASTYINNILIDADRVNPRGAGVNYGYANLGIREDKAESISTFEQASFDNIRVTSTINGTLTTLFEENFSDPTNFLFTTGTVVDGRLVVLGRSYSWQRDPTAITVYTIKMDVEIKAVAAGVCFGETDPNNFFMWQLNNDGKSVLRPHVWNSGNPSLITELDISSLIVLQSNTVYALRIEINGDKASTYINDILVDADRVNPRGGSYGYANLGFRGSHNDAGTSEEAFYDNITVTNVVNGAPSTLFSEDFSNATYAFDGGQLISGRLYTTGGPDVLIWQKALEVPTGAQTLTEDTKLSIYPNPVKDILTISTIPVDYQIFNLVGKQIQTGKGLTLNVADFAQGVYMVRVGNKISKFAKN